MQLLYLLIEIIVKCVVVFAGLMIVVAYLTWLERKVLGHIQIRYGPNRCGPFGLLQPFSDAIKAFFKEDLVPGRSDKALFVIAPMISIIAAISIFAVVPFGNQFTIPGTNWVVKLRWPMSISGFSISSAWPPLASLESSWEAGPPGISMV